MLSLFRRVGRREPNVLVDQAARSRDLASFSRAATTYPDGSGPPTGGLDADAAIAAARRRLLVFREFFPPALGKGLSFYGGAPVGPPDMVWPCDDDGLPLTFVMQWDVSALAALDVTGLLPRDGALYLFSTLEWGDRMLFRLVHVEVDGRSWEPLPPPDDLPPAFRQEAAHHSKLASRHLPSDRQDPPRLLPRWPFVPLAIDLPPAKRTDDDDLTSSSDGSRLKEALLRAQDPSATPTRERVGYGSDFARPFPGFPHDWAAVRVVAAAALDRLEPRPRLNWRLIMPDADDAAREELVGRWRAAALALYDEAVGQEAGAAIAADHADALWRRIEGLKLVYERMFDFVVQDSVNVSLGLDSAGVATIPVERLEACAPMHSLATMTMREEYAHEFAARSSAGLALDQAREAYRASRSPEDLKRVLIAEREVYQKFEQEKAADALHRVRDVRAPAPNCMFGPVSDIQGDAEEYVDEWLQLLELRSSDAIGFPLGDGVLQFLIRPHDLAAKRFDRVKVIASSA